jgi:glycosyltransferase involved in cell wall biosynthesis
MRIAYVYRSFSRAGSIASLYMRSAERLSLTEEVTAVCSRGGRVQTEAPVRFADVDPAVTGRDRFRYAIECHSFARRATRAVLQAADRYDVVHAEGFASRWADVVSVHAVRRAELDHYFEHVEPRAVVRRHVSPLLLRPQIAVVMSIERELFRSPAPLCISPSERVRSDLQRCHGVPRELVEVIPYGIDVGVLGHRPAARVAIRTREGIDDDQVVVLAVADEFERKGVDRLIEALALARARPHLWVMGGDDPRRYVQLARSAGVADRVRFLGRRPFDELPGWYAASDVVAVVSRQDSWALPVVEGMAAGRCVVASAFTGSDEAIATGANGFVVAGEGSPREIAALLDGPLADPDVRLAVGARAAADAQRYDVDVAHRALLGVYARAAQRRRERPVPALRPRAARPRVGALGGPVAG